MIENKSLRSKIFDILNIVILIAITLICIVPVWYVLCVSLSSREAVNAGKVALWPVGFNLLSYKKIMGETAFFGSFLVSIKRVLLGTGISMVCILMAAYPLSRTKKQFPKRNIFMWIFVFCMLFNGGTVPWYITMKNYHLMDNIFGLVLGTGLQVFNVILAVNFFKNLPTELEEACFVDGGGPWRTLISIYIPLAKPMVATVALFTMVMYWNDKLIDPEMLVRSDSKEPLLSGKVGIFFGPWWSGYTVSDTTLAGEADWRAYFTPLSEDGNYYAHMPNPTSKYVVASKSCKNPEAAFKIVNYLIKNEQQWVVDGITSTEMGTADFYPLYNGYDNADEIEVSTETLEKYLAGEITMDDVDFSKHKLLKNDMEAVKELKKEPYDDFSLDKWNLDSDIAKTNLPRLVSLLVGGSPLVNDKYVPVYNAYNGQTKTMEAKWANLKKMEEETFSKIIMGKADISEFDTFVENWKNQGGDQILKEINDELSK